MNILIIGGTGLISPPAHHAYAAGAWGCGHALQSWEIGPVPCSAEVKTIHGDRTDYPAFEKQMHELGTFDCVMDMVGYLPDDGPSVVRAFRGRMEHFIFCSNGGRVSKTGDAVSVARKPSLMVG